MSDPAQFMLTEGGPVTRDEAAALATLHKTITWGPLERILQAERSDSVTAVMDEKTTPERAAFEKGRFAALGDLIGMLTKTLPEQFAKAVAEAEPPAPKTDT